tara:strand:+ start:418 stop:846 length:429 start_codon:yes stop_codon:yes gene_type:complete
MATNSKWVVIFNDRKVTKNYDEGAGDGTPGTKGLGYFNIGDDAFWNQAKFSNIWAIQYGTSVASDEVEHRDETPHCSYADANLGDFQQFIDKWDAAHLAFLQSEWDEGYDPKTDIIGPEDETEAEKITRMGPRPTSYSSSPA